MNWDQIAGMWKQWGGRIRQKWGKLTDDDIQHIAGKRDELAGKLQERYGIEKEEAHRQIDEWEREHAEADKTRRAGGL